MENLPTEIKGFSLENPEKVERALVGTVAGSGQHIGGVQKTDGTFDDDALLAEYDRIGGFISKNGDKVRTGSFYDFTNKKPREKTKVEFVFRINDREVIVPEGEELPGIVKAKKVADEMEMEEKATKKTTIRKSKKDEDEE